MEKCMTANTAAGATAWAARYVAQGFFIGLGVWLGLAVVGTRIACIQ